MAARRPYQGYGSQGSKAPQPRPSAPMPPPPDGRPPVRLPIGEPGVTGNEEADDDILQQLIRQGFQ